jgi:hypothetical protein
MPAEKDFFLFAAMMLSVDVYAIHAIENGAFFSVNEKGLSYIVMVAIVIIANAITSIIKNPLLYPSALIASCLSSYSQFLLLYLVNNIITANTITKINNNIKPSMTIPPCVITTANIAVLLMTINASA